MGLKQNHRHLVTLCFKIETSAWFLTPFISAGCSQKNWASTQISACGSQGVKAFEAWLFKSEIT